MRQVGIRALLRSETFSTTTMVRKTRSQEIVDDEDIPATQHSVNELQAQVTALVAAVAALTTQNAAPTLRNRRDTRPNSHDDSEEEEDDDNPFAPLGRTNQNRNNNNDFDSDNDVDKKSWKSSFKLEILEFKGSTIPEELLDWFVTVEEILEFKEIPLDRCVPFIAIRFRDRAPAWWSQTKTTRTRLGKSKISTWAKLKKKMQKKFTLQLRSTNSLSEAHQQAITVENQSRMGSQPWGSTRQSRTTTTPATVTTPEATTNKSETAIVPANAAQ
uniref:Retrotransposon gag domain-containing protein n=1 Tax=Brassica oleracea var. oleracea TaxID=109376 RepID=A0A0D3AM03_BRAOL